jgi:dTMP kinase
VSESRGHLIAFEGTEGTGKSTQLRLAADALRQAGWTVRETREPGGTLLGQEIRRLVMHLDGDVPTPLTELLLYLADRAQHLDTVIRPALAAGELVLTDRFSASTIAYQGYGRGLDVATVTELDALVRGDVTADLTILLDCPVEIGLERARGDDRFHRADLAFHERVRRGFHEQVSRAPGRFHIIDVTRERDIVAADVLAAVQAHVSK